MCPHYFHKMAHYSRYFKDYMVDKGVVQQMRLTALHNFYI